MSNAAAVSPFEVLKKNGNVTVREDIADQVCDYVCVERKTSPSERLDLFLFGGKLVLGWERIGRIVLIFP